MVTRKLISIIIIAFLIFPKVGIANPNLDQWLDTDKTCKICRRGYELKVTQLVI